MLYFHPGVLNILQMVQKQALEAVHRTRLLPCCSLVAVWPKQADGLDFFRNRRYATDHGVVLVVVTDEDFHRVLVLHKVFFNAESHVVWSSLRLQAIDVVPRSSANFIKRVVWPRHLIVDGIVIRPVVFVCVVVPDRAHEIGGGQLLLEHDAQISSKGRFH